MYEQDFIIKKERDLENLGSAFARALHPDNSAFERIFHLGFFGESESGKTTLNRAIFNALGIDVSIEVLNARPFEAQDDVVAVSHYDALDDPDYEPLENPQAHINIIAVEHPDEDFLADFSFYFTKTAAGQKCLTLICASEETEQDGFLEFLADLQNL